jgi:uncharacterized membrane protein
MLIDVLAGLLLLLGGAMAGVLMAVEVAVVPMLARLPGDRYVQTHRMLDPRFDPLMPTIGKLGLGIGLATVYMAPTAQARIAFGIAGAGFLGVALVSELSNVRINRSIDTWEEDRLPPGWAQARARWARSNRCRTVIAAVGFTATVFGVGLI